MPVADPTLREPRQCAAAGYTANANYLPGLAQYDLTRGGSLFQFRGRTDIKQEAAYLEDNIAWRSWNFLIGGRADNYNGLSSRSMLQPRLGVTYTYKPTATVLKIGYSKLFPTPYNENLILSSSTGAGGLAASGGCVRPVRAEARQAKPVQRRAWNRRIGRHAVLSADYFWKYTDRDFDFDVLFNTPLTFPIQWRKSKIDGFDARLTFPHQYGFDGYVALGHTRARFFGPETGGIIFNSPLEYGSVSHRPRPGLRADHARAVSAEEDAALGGAHMALRLRRSRRGGAGLPDGPGIHARPAGSRYSSTAERRLPRIAEPDPKLQQSRSRERSC